MKISKSFVKYCMGGGIKTAINLLLLWVFIDKLVLPIPNTFVRFVIFGFTFLLTYYIYKVLGYSKDE